jgi:hypothetical protein
LIVHNFRTIKIDIHYLQFKKTKSVKIGGG